MEKFRNAFVNERSWIKETIRAKIEINYNELHEFISEKMRDEKLINKTGKTLVYDFVDTLESNKQNWLNKSWMQFKKQKLKDDDIDLF